MKVYRSYIVNYQPAHDLLKKLSKEDKKFADFLEVRSHNTRSTSCPVVDTHHRTHTTAHARSSETTFIQLANQRINKQKQFFGYDMESFLITPVQRVPRYICLLRVRFPPCDAARTAMWVAQRPKVSCVVSCVVRGFSRCTSSRVPTTRTTSSSARPSSAWRRWPRRTTERTRPTATSTSCWPSRRCSTHRCEATLPPHGRALTHVFSFFSPFLFFPFLFPSRQNVNIVEPNRRYVHEGRAWIAQVPTRTTAHARTHSHAHHRTPARVATDAGGHLGGQGQGDEGGEAAVPAAVLGPGGRGQDQGETSFSQDHDQRHQGGCTFVPLNSHMFCCICCACRVVSCAYVVCRVAECYQRTDPRLTRRYSDVSRRAAGDARLDIPVPDGPPGHETLHRKAGAHPQPKHR
jgi:hypothetical protein